MIAVGFVLGASVMFFQGPSSGFLGKAFLGARALEEQKRLPAAVREQTRAAVPLERVNRPEKTYDGFTLYAELNPYLSRSPVYLINMRGDVVHEWGITFSEAFPKRPHVSDMVRDNLVCVFATYLYPNGELLVVLHGKEQQANGYGLVKLDKDSRVLWTYVANAHHDVDVGEDGSIYAIQHQVYEKLPKGLEALHTPCLADSIAHLSADGKPLGEPVSILEAFRDSPYAAYLDAIPRAGGPETTGSMTAEHMDEEMRKRDALHTNSVKVLTSELAPKFSRFRAGQVLISICALDTVAVLDLEQRTVVWAAHGPWKRQHDAHFLPSGRLLIFDNRGPSEGSRVLEYNPETQTIPWSYAGENGGGFYTGERGMSQRLPNGNTLIVSSETGQLLEVTPEREVAWTWHVPSRFITTARRYRADQLTFLKGDKRARP